MKLIEQIEIKNFRSFGNRKQETTKVVKIGDLNVFSGANDSGKSNILRALNLFFNGKTNLEDFYDFEKDFFKKENKDEKDIKEELTTIKLWFINSRNKNKNKNRETSSYLPGKFWVSKKWKKTSEFSQGTISSNVEKTFQHEKGALYDYFIDEKGKLKSQFRASLAKQLTEFLNSIQYHYVPAIKDRRYFSHLYGELQQTLWKAKKSKVDIKKAAFEKEIQKETNSLMNDFKSILNHPTLKFEPVFELPQDL
ncbi:MAG: AAA family ATPase, partial [Sphingomonadales bacterium]